MRRRYVEFGGHVHLVGVIGGGEHTLCGVAFDAADSEHDESLRRLIATANGDAADFFRLRWTPTRKRTVTCPTCGAVVLLCQFVKVAPQRGVA